MQGTTVGSGLFHLDGAVQDSVLLSPGTAQQAAMKITVMQRKEYKAQKFFKIPL